MGQFGDAAKKAVMLIEENVVKTPQEAWDKAIPEYTSSEWVRKKSCPKTTFLSLCEEGVVQGIPSGSYAPRAKENKDYVLRAIYLLKKNSNLDDLEKMGDGQTDVIASLWNAGLINVD